MYGRNIQEKKYRDKGCGIVQGVDIKIYISDTVRDAVERQRRGYSRTREGDTSVRVRGIGRIIESKALT